MVFEADATPEEREFDRALRPPTFDDFVGQDAIRDNLRIAIDAARQRREPLDHVLLVGPPGLGKTSLSHLIAGALATDLVVTAGPALAAPRDLAGTLTRLVRGDVLFVDEIHRTPRAVEEYLYTAMEDHAIDINLDPGPAGRSIRIPIEPFTLIGATTREGLLSSAFRSRFGLIERLEPYPDDDIREIVERASLRLPFPIDTDAAQLIARRSRGVPRVALRMQRRVRDLAQVRGEPRATAATAAEGMARLKIDELGLEEMDRKILRALIERGEPTGINTLSAMVDESEDTLADVFEPHLLRCGLIVRTPRGRVVTRKAYAHLGIAPPAEPPTQRSLELPFSD